MAYFKNTVWKISSVSSRFFQMNPADPPNGVGIAVNCLTDLFLAAHHITPFLQAAASLRPPPHSPPACALIVADTIAIFIHIPPTCASPACGPNRAASRKNHRCCQCSCQNLFHFLCLLSHILCVG